VARVNLVNVRKRYADGTVGLRFDARADGVESTGADLYVHAGVGAERVVARPNPATGVRPGERITLGAGTRACLLLRRCQRQCAGAGMTRLLLAYDGSAAASSAIEAAAALFPGAEAVIATVEPPAPTLETAGMARVALSDSMIREGHSRTSSPST
jgi:hypothetical protein